MSMVVGDLVAYLRLNDKEYDSGLKNAEGKAKASGSRIGSSMAKIGGALTAVAIGDVLKDSINAASELNETVSKTSNVFGEQAAQVMAWSNSSAQAFGLSKQAALAAASQYGDMFHQLGFTQQASAKTSESLIKMAADLGSFHNVDPSDVLDRIGGALRGEYDSLQQLIPNISAARVEQEALTETHKKSAKQLTAAEKATAVLAIIQKDGSNAANDFAETSGGLANQQRIVAAQVENLKAKLGAGLTPVLASLLGFITGVAIPGLSKLGGFVHDNATAFEIAAAAIAPFVLILAAQAAITAVASTVTAAYTAVKAIFITTTDAETGAVTLSTVAKARGLAITVAATAGTVAGTVVGIAARIAIEAWTAAQWLLNAAMSANPIALVVLAIVGLVAIFIVAWKHSETFRNVVTGAFNAVLNVVKSTWSWIKSNWPLLLAILTGPIGLAVLYITRHWDSIVSTVKGLPGRIASAASGMWDGIKSSFRSAVNWIIDRWNNFHLTIGGGSILGQKLPEVTLNTPNIAHLAKGGVVRARPGGTLALLGEGGHDEQVTPLDGRHQGTQLQVIIHNPAPEPPSESISRALRRLAVVGVVPGPVTG